MVGIRETEDVTVAPVVKALAWKDCHDMMSSARTPFGTIWLGDGGRDFDRPGEWYCAFDSGPYWFGNKADAKAAAQADYERRILSALEGSGRLRADANPKETPR